MGTSNYFNVTVAPVQRRIFFSMPHATFACIANISFLADQNDMELVLTSQAQNLVYGGTSQRQKYSILLGGMGFIQ